MNETIWLASGGILTALALIIAAYHTGRHNAVHSGQPQPGSKPTGGPLDPGFVLNTIEDGVIMIGADGAIRLFNPAAAKITGRKAEEVISLDFHPVLPLADEHGKPYEEGRHPFDKVLASNQSLRDSNSLLITASGRQMPVSLVISPVSQSQPSGLVAVLRDITREKAEESERAEFISTASHEMRTPIASIEGYLSLVLNSKTSRIDTPSRGFLEKAHQATQHLGQLFQDLLTTTKAEDSRLASHPEPFDLGTVIAGVAEEVKPLAEKKGLNLHLLASTGESAQGKVVRPLFMVKADPERIKEVVRNLLDNAIKYTKAGNITIRLTGDRTVVQFQVSDSGVGIPPEDIPHLFQKFYRVDSSLTREVGGTGLGLFICRKILELYDGRIWVESQTGKGSTFFVNLPRLDNLQVSQASNAKKVMVKSA